MGIYQLRFMRIPDHAAVNESVKLTQKLKKKWAKGFVNGVLRSCSREEQKFDQKIAEREEANYAHPQWLLKKLQEDWPDDWSQIAIQNNQQAPMVLRVNQQKSTVDDYIQRLSERKINALPLDYAENAVLLQQACDVNMLPGFEQGVVSVQDSAAQQAAMLLDLNENCYVLDACAAPGGKTAHILETKPSVKMLALDLSDKRVELIKDTLARLTLKAEVRSADAQRVEDWWDGRMFDRILLDAPCSATGVIRRNPDIKIHRSAKDIEAVVNAQKTLLDRLWPLLKPGGILLYATCSILKDENENQIQQFLDKYDDATEVKLNVAWGKKCKAGVQVLPGDHQMDGFYYAKIKKNS
jgi:16S rRNA (cytosine967-C5)-methyltransferase